jgi:uncharacterized membrane protein
MDKSKRDTLLMIAMAAAIAKLQTGIAEAADYEKCYGVALKGQNDCAAEGTTCAGTSKVDYDGRYWKTVAKGSCVTTETPLGPGSLEPIKRPS